MQNSIYYSKILLLFLSQSYLTEILESVSNAVDFHHFRWDLMAHAHRRVNRVCYFADFGFKNKDFYLKLKLMNRFPLWTMQWRIVAEFWNCHNEILCSQASFCINQRMLVLRAETPCIQHYNFSRWSIHFLNYTSLSQSTESPTYHE